MTRPNTVADFWSKVTVRGPDECWPWKDHTRGRGKLQYGFFFFHGKRYAAHRFVWMIVNGKLPRLKGTDGRGTCVLHTCDFGLCCNPKHLFLGTHKRNMEDKVEKKRDTPKYKTHCKHGHERTPENIYVTSKGLRMCRVCHRLTERERRERRIARHKEQRTS